jgi:hypothetical protein
VKKPAVYCRTHLDYFAARARDEAPMPAHGRLHGP